MRTKAQSGKSKKLRGGGIKVEYITKAALDLLENNKMYRSVPKFWDGRAAQRIVEAIWGIGETGSGGNGVTLLRTS